MKRLNLVLAEDHEMMSQGLRAMLEPHYHVVAVEPDGEKVVSVVQKCRPDVLLLDLSLPKRTGMDVLADLARVAPRLRVVVVTMHVDRALAEMAIRLGASGFVPKDAGVEELCTAIEEAVAGRRYISPKVPRRTHRGPAADPMGFSRFTPRQQQIVRMIGQGMTSDQMAAALGLSAHTIHFHRKNIRRQIGVHTDWEMVRYAMLVAMSEEPPPSLLPEQVGTDKPAVRPGGGPSGR